MCLSEVLYVDFVWSCCVVVLAVFDCCLGPPMMGREGSTQFAQQLASAVTAPPLVGCVVWSLLSMLVNVLFASCMSVLLYCVFVVGLYC